MAKTPGSEGLDMTDWQIDIIKLVVHAIIAGIGGWWGHWRWTREKQKEADLRERRRLAEYDQKAKEADLREQQRQAEYEEFKKKRRLVGAGEVERMERAEKLTELIIKHRQHQITPEEFNLYRMQIVAGKKIEPFASLSVARPEKETKSGQAYRKGTQHGLDAFFGHGDVRGMSLSELYALAIDAVNLTGGSSPEQLKALRDVFREVERFPAENLFVRSVEEIKSAMDRINRSVYYWELRAMLEDPEHYLKGVKPEVYDDLVKELETDVREIEQAYKDKILGDGSTLDRAVLEGEHAAFLWLTDRDWPNTHLWTETPTKKPPDGQ